MRGATRLLTECCAVRTLVPDGEEMKFCATGCAVNRCFVIFGCYSNNRCRFLFVSFRHEGHRRVLRVGTGSREQVDVYVPLIYHVSLECWKFGYTILSLLGQIKVNIFIGQMALVLASSVNEAHPTRI